MSAEEANIIEKYWRLDVREETSYYILGFHMTSSFPKIKKLSILLNF